MDSHLSEEGPRDAPHILVIDDDASVREVLAVLLNEEGYVCTCVSNADEALSKLAETEYQLAICDLAMPGHDGLWLLERIRDSVQNTAVIMLTGCEDTASAVECLRRGADDYLLKPPKITELVKAIERALAKHRVSMAQQRYQHTLEKNVEDKTKALKAALSEIEAAYNTTLQALVAALDAREHETSDHSLRVVRFSEAIARRMGMSESEMLIISRGALLHDIGKIGVPDSILLKPGPLDPTEWAEMRNHPKIGFNILRKIDFLRGPSEIVLSHHERFDGNGYPNKLLKDAIPIGARIFAVADTLDAITSDRPYRKARSFETAQLEIKRCSGTQFDPEIVHAFLSIDEEEFLWSRELAAQSPFAI